MLDSVVYNRASSLHVRYDIKLWKYGLLLVFWKREKFTLLSHISSELPAR